ncbi:hypothetical protein ALC53_04926 [Atta colombica]|uniref:Uncharacterized protein n=1 Tax=Atta colombica TaxID=520822 RepID=A0A195BKG3_9HYME|nr:hypothetical protein ALC53_04926 [Atta colombica]
MGRLENFDIRENRGILTPDGRQIDLLCRTSATTISSNKNQLHFSNEIHSCSTRKRNPLSDEFMKKPGSLRPQGIKRAQHTVSIEFCGSCVRASLRLALHFPLLHGFTQHVAVLLFFIMLDLQRCHKHSRGKGLTFSIKRSKKFYEKKPRKTDCVEGSSRRKER